MSQVVDQLTRLITATNKCNRRDWISVSVNGSSKSHAAGYNVELALHDVGQLKVI